MRFHKALRTTRQRIVRAGVVIKSSDWVFSLTNTSKLPWRIKVDPLVVEDFEL
jgi:hypothetical protein